MKVIINRTDAIGDTLLTLPMAKAIKERYPSAIIHFLVSSKTKDIFLHHKSVDEVTVYDRTIPFFKRLFELLRLFKRIKPDVYFYVGGGHTPSFIAFLLRVPIRGGIKSKWQSFLFLNKAMRQRRSAVEMHESDYNLSLLKVMDIDYNAHQRGNYSPEIHLTQVELENSKNDLSSMKAECGIVSGDEFIVVHPGMVGHTLNWPMRYYLRLIDRIEKEYPKQFFYLLSHTPSDKKYIDEIKSELDKDDLSYLKEHIIFFNGQKRGLRHYMATIAHAKLFIGPSTGTTHLANALGLKQIAIYSPIRAQSAFRWGPFKRDEKRVKLVVPDAVCGEQRECQGPDCPYYFCMERIEVDEVFESVKELLTTKEMG